MLLGGAAVFVARDLIAERLARQWLARHGVVSSLTLRSLSTTALSASLRLGDAKDPDLTVERLEVAYTLNGPWNGKPLGVDTRRLRLVHPRLRLRLVGGRMNLGAVQTLFSEVAKLPPSGEPPPDVVIEDGTVILQTPVGQASFRGGALVQAGALVSVDGKLEPFSINASGVRLNGQGGTLRLSRGGARLIPAIDLGPITASQGLDRLSLAGATLRGEFPYPDAHARLAGPVRLALAANGVSADIAGGHAQGATMDAELRGDLDIGGARRSVVGRMVTTGRVALLSGRGTWVRAATARIDLSHLSVAGDGSGLTMVGDGTAGMAAAGVVTTGVRAFDLAGAGRLTDLRVQIRGGRASGGGRFDGGLGGRGAASEATAQRIGQAATALTGEPAYGSAITSGLGGFRFATPRWRVVVSDHGARLSLAQPASVVAELGRAPDAHRSGRRAEVRVARRPRRGGPRDQWRGPAVAEPANRQRRPLADGLFRRHRGLGRI